MSAGRRLLGALITCLAGCGRIGYAPLSTDSGWTDSASGGAGGRAVAGGTGGSSRGDGGADCTLASRSKGQMYALCEGPLSWSDAAADCALKGMHLVGIHDTPENGWILTNAFATVTGNLDSLAVWRWLGGTDQAVEGEWRWSDGTLFWVGASNGAPQGGLYTNFGGGQPNDGGGNEDCLVMQHNVQGFWADVGCASLQPYVCKQ